MRQGEDMNLTNQLSPELIKFLFNNPIFGIVVIDKNRIIHQVNERFVDMAGYDTPEELLGMDSRQLYFSEDAYQLFGKKYTESLMRNQIIRADFPFKMKSGQSIWCSVSGQIIRSNVLPEFEGGAIWIVEDISKEIQTTKALERAYRELETIFSNSMVGILMVKDDRIVHKVNQRFLDITGYQSFEDIEGLSVEDFHVSHSHYEHFGRHYYSNLINHEMIAVDYQFKRKDGQIIWVNIAGKAVDPNSPPDLNQGVVWTLTDITDKKIDEAKLTQMAITDDLTGLFNRRYFLKAFDEEIHRHKTLQTDFSVLMIDLDYFKSINDAFGHNIGDQVLKDFADLCQSTLRTSDVIGRLGGEEFGILLPGAKHTVAYNIAESIRRKTESYPWSVNKKITISIGLASSDQKESLDQVMNIMKIADEKLYKAKENGRNQTQR